MKIYLFIWKKSHHVKGSRGISGEHLASTMPIVQQPLWRPDWVSWLELSWPCRSTGPSSVDGTPDARPALPRPGHRHGRRRVGVRPLAGSPRPTMRAPRSNQRRAHPSGSGYSKNRGCQSIQQADSISPTSGLVCRSIGGQKPGSSPLFVKVCSIPYSAMGSPARISSRVEHSPLSTAQSFTNMRFS